MSDEGNRPEDDRWKVTSTNTEWGPYPGDELARGATPPAPEIPMSKTWPWVAGAAVVLRVLLPILLIAAVVLAIVGLVAHWF